MTILVTGGAGFVGNNVIRKLVEQGKPVRAMVRHPEKAQKRLGNVSGDIEIVRGDVTDRHGIKAHFEGCSAVVHTVAISMEKGGATYEEVNYQGTINVVDAAREAGVPRFINVSQNGADSSLPYRFLASKGRAQEYVAATDLQWTAVRPSAIFGPQDEFFNTFARLLRLTPIVFPLIGGGKAEFQPVSIYDVAEAIARSLDDNKTIGQELALGGPEVLTLGAIERRIIKTLDTSRILVPAPVGLLRPVVAIMQNVLPGSPVSTSLLDLLAVPNTVPDNALMNVFLMDPIPFAGKHITYLREASAGQALTKFFTGKTIN
ncbi:complex I NDUFA9 subunit family protein [Phototrophicus methaneseepsis]|uniref:Complex I NDUFA9 subunit family protein n=1 Tax=Phototrophicus methaneseepsis TaxID=2710758 RepID=A0A7S8EBC5_9CHLR|nr:complex I NDUFA9 subunit family protein [Phototrophicus methaneseepsis]QPC83807.1 complex I NDUFA9 subunit family protein [Phototrophicus methaneseepsis]